MRRTIKLTNRQAEYNPTKRRGEILRETLARLQPTLETRTAQTAVAEPARAMSRFLLNIEKRPLSWFTLSGVGLASKNAI